MRFGNKVEISRILPFILLQEDKQNEFNPFDVSCCTARYDLLLVYNNNVELF